MKSRRNRCKRQGFGGFNRLSQLSVRLNHRNSYAARIDSIMRGWRNFRYRHAVGEQASVCLRHDWIRNVFNPISTARFRNGMRYDKDYI